MTFIKTEFNVTQEALFSLVAAMPNPANIKNAHTGKYIIANKSELDAFILKNVDDMIGLTVHDLDNFMRPHWGNFFAEEVAALDKEVQSSGQSKIIKNRVFRDRRGIVHIRDVCKCPFFSCSNNKQVTAIITLTFDYTDETNLITLYGKYKQIYNNKSDAIKYFSQYLKISDFFYDPLTEKELLCLLIAKVHQTHKDMANNLGITIKTIEAHLSNITNKLKQVSVRDVIVFLRNKKNANKENN